MNKVRKRCVKAESRFSAEDEETASFLLSDANGQKFIFVCEIG
jgi:hypothetical protein